MSSIPQFRQVNTPHTWRRWAEMARSIVQGVIMLPSSADHSWTQASTELTGTRTSFRYSGPSRIVKRNEHNDYAPRHWESAHCIVYCRCDVLILVDTSDQPGSGVSYCLQPTSDSSRTAVRDRVTVVCAVCLHGVGWNRPPNWCRSR